MSAIDLDEEAMSRNGPKHQNTFVVWLYPTNTYVAYLCVGGGGTIEWYERWLPLVASTAYRFSELCWKS